MGSFEFVWSFLREWLRGNRGLDDIPLGPEIGKPGDPAMLEPAKPHFPSIELLERPIDE